jgi:hypothetical protein
MTGKGSPLLEFFERRRSVASPVVRFLASTAAVLLVAACSHTHVSELPPGHPANPGAAPAPAHARSAVLSIDSTAPVTGEGGAKTTPRKGKE